VNNSSAILHSLFANMRRRNNIPRSRSEHRSSKNLTVDCSLSQGLHSSFSPAYQIISLCLFVAAFMGGCYGLRDFGRVELVGVYIQGVYTRCSHSRLRAYAQLFAQQWIPSLSPLGWILMPLLKRSKYNFMQNIASCQAYMCTKNRFRSGLRLKSAN